MMFGAPGGSPADSGFTPVLFNVEAPGGSPADSGFTSDCSVYAVSWRRA